jgi:hypothetical protein
MPGQTARGPLGGEKGEGSHGKEGIMESWG